MINKVKTWGAGVKTRAAEVLDREPFKAAGLCAVFGAALGLVIGLAAS